MTTTSEDLIENPLVTDWMIHDAMYNTRLYQAGIVREDSNLGIQVLGNVNQKKAEGKIYTVRLLDYEHKPSQRVNEDMSCKPLVHGFGSHELQGRKHYRSNGWAETELTKIWTSASPLEAFRGFLNTYWDKEIERLSMLCFKGMLAQINAANRQEEFIEDVSTTTGEPVRASAKAFVRAIMKMEDQFESIRAIGIHPHVYTALWEEDLIETETVKEKGRTIKRYQDRELIVLRDMPMNPGEAGENDTYTTLLFGEGLMRFAPDKNTAKNWYVPDSLGGRGSGQEQVYTRLYFGMHPVGFEYNLAIQPSATDVATEGSPAAQREVTYSDAQLESADLWRVKYDDARQVPFRVLVSN